MNLEVSVNFLANKHSGFRYGHYQCSKSDLFLVRISTSVTKDPHS